MEEELLNYWEVIKCWTMVLYNYIEKITKWEWYGDSNTSRTFIHLLVTANYYDAQWRGIEVKKGQRISSYSVLAKELNLSVKEIRTAINHLKRTGEVAHQNCHEYGLFTVVHYFDYQGRAHQGADVGHTKGRPQGTRRATNK